MTHKSRKNQEVLLPHINWLKDTNPQVDIHVIVGEDSPLGRVYNWKNSDQQLRKWWKLNRDHVNGEVIAVIEWDTLVGCELPKLPEGYDLVGKTYINYKRNKTWYWWQDFHLLELKSIYEACGLVSFGFFLMKRQVLDSFCDPCFDKIYEKNILNELRFPTCAKLKGFKLGEIRLPFVEWHDVKLTTHKGIYHGINKEFNGVFTGLKSKKLWV